MAREVGSARSRRALLRSAVTGAAAAAAASLALPATVLAVDPDDVAKNTDNPTTGLTSITQGTADTGGFKATALGTGTGVDGVTGADGVGTRGQTTGATRAGVFGLAAADESEIAGTPWEAGVYGFANISSFSSGVWGDSIDGTGLIGTGQWGMIGIGYPGILGYSANGTGVQAHGGPGLIPVAIPNTGVLASAEVTGWALYVLGRAKFSRSGRVTVGRGRSSVRINMVGVSSGSLVFASLQSNRSGRYIRAAVPTTGYFTVYFNLALTAASYVSYFVLN